MDDLCVYLPRVCSAETAVTYYPLTQLFQDLFNTFVDNLNVPVHIHTSYNTFPIIQEHPRRGTLGERGYVN